VKPNIEIRILGPLVVTAEHGAIGLPRALERAILAFLVLNVGEVVPTDRLLDELWPESPPESARHSLHVHVSRLRKTLGDHVLVTRSPGYLLALDEEQIDACRFEAWVRDGRRALRKAHPKKAARLFRQALALRRGSPLPELAHLPYGRIQISHLEELRFEALEELFEAELALGHHAEVVEGLTGLAEECPFRERLWGHLMVALYRSGRQADALLAFQDLKRLLGEELGINPGPELQLLEEAIILQKSELGWGEKGR
jgi:DNA-binding SARP family transcriptional activator